jgi:hypothetical protein
MNPLLLRVRQQQQFILNRPALQFKFDDLLAGHSARCHFIGKKVYSLWERHLAATLSWLEATPTKKELNLLGRKSSNLKAFQD